MILEMLKYVLAGFALLLATAVEAARPMVTDDARVVEARSCQLETWTRFNRRGSEYWALPGCNVGADTEVTLGGARGDSERGTATSDVVFQAKHLLRPLPPDGWGAAVALGQVKHPAIDQGGNLLGDFYVNVPVSLAFQGERRVLHLNAGWLHDRAAGRERATWGLGSEAWLDDRAQLIAEGYGQSGERPYYQGGLRFWLLPQRLQIDTTLGGQAGGGDVRWVSVGFRLLSPAFLP